MGSNAAIENFLTRGVSWSSRGASFSVVGAMDRPRKPRDHIVRVIDATESEVTYQLQVLRSRQAKQPGQPANATFVLCYLGYFVVEEGIAKE